LACHGAPQAGARARSYSNLVRLHTEKVPIRVAFDYFLFLKLISDRLKDATDAAVLAGDGIIELGGVAGPACEHLIPQRDRVHHAIPNDGRGLKAVSVVSRLENPGRTQAFDVRSIDPIKRAVTPRRLSPAVMRPIGASGAVESLALDAARDGEE